MTTVAAVASWCATAMLVVVGLVSGDTHYFLEAIGPLLAAVVFTGQRILEIDNAVVVFIVAATTITVTYELIGDHTTIVPATVALVLIATLGTLFVERSHVVYISGGTLWMLATPMIWQEASWASTGATMAVSFVVGAVILLSVRRSALVSHHRYQQMFELAPIGLMEQDWTEAVQVAAAVPDEGRNELRDRLEHDPEFVRLIISAVRVARVNTEIGAIAGVPPSRLADTAGLAEVLPADTDAWIDQIVAVMHGDDGYYAEHATRRFTGEQIFVGVRSISIERSTGKVRRLVAIDDITEQRMAEQATADLVRAKDQFIASVSHELRTPLTAIVGFTSTIAGESVDPHERDEITAMVHAQATEMSHIVEDLLVAARADAGSITVKTEPVDMRQAAHSAVRQCHTCSVRIHAPDDAVATADAVRVGQILRNLITNAERYGTPPVEVTITRTDRFVITDVRDRGPELSEHDRERIFEPYVRAHDEPGGVTAAVGLGLAVSHQLAQLMGGSLTYGYDQGSVFRLRLPVARTGRRDTDTDGARLPTPIA